MTEYVSLYMNSNLVGNPDSIMPIIYYMLRSSARESRGKQGRIHGSPVAEGWTGAVMQKPIGIQKCDRPTDGPTRQGVESRVRD